MTQVIDLDGERPGRRRRAGAAAVAAGAQRASGERARRRRRTTPLLADLEPASDAGTVAPHDPADRPTDRSVVDGPSGHAAAAPPEEIDLRAFEAPVSARRDNGAPRARTGTGTPRSPSATRGVTVTTPTSPPASAPTTAPTTAQTDGTDVPAADAGAVPRRPARKAVRSSRTTIAATPGTSNDPAGPAVGDAGGPAPAARRPPRAAVRSASGARRPRVRPPGSGPERLVAVTDAATEAGEAIADALGHRPGDVEEKIAAALAFLRRRLTGDYEVDEFGFDRELTETVLLALVRPLYRRWFRVEVRGIENIPDTGGALLVANHSGAVALDSVMTQVAVHDTHPQHRFLRMLGADLVFSTPFVGEIARKGGATLAANADAERLLSAGEVVGVWPEGFKGIGKPFSERYKLQRFGRGGFVSAALRTRTPIVPCAIVGAEETYPILGNIPTLARLLGLPYFPVTPTFPLLGLLGAIPLPSKWLIEFGTPVPTDDLGIGAADDPMLVFDLTDQIRQTIQQTLYSLLVQRRSVFF